VVTLGVAIAMAKSHGESAQREIKEVTTEERDADFLMIRSDFLSVGICSIWWVDRSTKPVQ
jgi:hypothetical protein